MGDGLFGDRTGQEMVECRIDLPGHEIDVDGIDLHDLGRLRGLLVVGKPLGIGALVLPRRVADAPTKA